eukprot:Partr_v1_DN26707_c1_g1_i2_m8280 putative thiamin pyrophosphokinase
MRHWQIDRIQNETPLLLLNTPWPPFDQWRSLFRTSGRFIICADGALNRLHDLIQSEFSSTATGDYLPDVVCGDLDSVRADVLAYYRSFDSVHIEHVSEQDSTDFEKCLNYIIKAIPDCGKVNVLGGLGGRLDHTLASIRALYAFAKGHGHVQVTVYGVENIVCLLHGSQKHQVTVNRSLAGPHCGLISFGSASGGLKAVTSGLEWDITEDMGPLGFSSGLFSACNRLRGEVVDISLIEATGDYSTGLVFMVEAHYSNP